MDHVHKWNELLTTKLEPQLTDFATQLQTVETTIQEYVELLHIITTLRSRPMPSSPIEAKIEHPIGSGNYVPALVPDTSKIFVDVGSESHVEMSLKEAEFAVKRRIIEFQNQREQLKADMTKLNKDIFIGMTTVRHLQELEDNQKK